MTADGIRALPFFGKRWPGWDAEAQAQHCREVADAYKPIFPDLAEPWYEWAIALLDTDKHAD